MFEYTKLDVPAGDNLQRCGWGGGAHGITSRGNKASVIVLIILMSGSDVAILGGRRVGVAAQTHHSASRCSTSLRKPVWNPCRGSKVEKTAFFRDSGVASSGPTAFWKDWDGRAKRNSTSACGFGRLLFFFFFWISKRRPSSVRPQSDS